MVQCPAGLAALVDSANGYAAEAAAPATARAYAADMATFVAWCTLRGVVPLPATAATLAVYVAWLADNGRRPSTIGRALAGIGAAHRAVGAEWAGGAHAVRAVMAGIRNRLGVAAAAKAPVEEAELRGILAACGAGLGGLRDRALITLGWFGAMRRSEIVALDVADARFVRDGLVVNIRRSKTDQEGRGREVALTYQGDGALCPVRALRDWLAAAGVEAGPLLRAVDRHGNIAVGRLSDAAVARTVKALAGAAGLDAAAFAGHSLRAGFATTAARQGKGLDAIMRQTGHRSESIARRYIRHGTLFADNATARLF